MAGLFFFPAVHRVDGGWYDYPRRFAAPAQA